MNELHELTRTEFRAYRDANVCDELCHHLVHVESFQEYLKAHGLSPDSSGCNILQGGMYLTETHHIWGGGTGRKDYRSNIIRVHQITHRWAGENPQESRIACMWAKSAKGDAAEFNLDELNAAAGFNVMGRIESYEVGEPFAEWRRLLTGGA